MKPKSPLTKKLVGGQHRLPAELKQEILNSPAKMKENFGTGDKKTERKLNRINRKIQKQHAKQDRNEDKGTKRGDRRADKAHAKGRKLLAKGRAIKKASDERTAKESPAKMVTAPDSRVSVKKGTSKSIGPAESKAAINAKRNKMKAAEKQAQKDNPKEFMPESKASKKASKDYKDARSFVK